MVAIGFTTRNILAAAIPRPFRVLALHGKGGTGPSFEYRLRPLIEASGAEWTFPTAPHPTENGGGAWWNMPPGFRSFEAPSFDGVPESLSVIESVWEKDGPFDCIMGHSQGAMLAAVVLAQGSLHPSTTTVRPRCGLLTGAAWPNPYTDLLEELALSKREDENIPPTLHCWGTADTTNPPQMARKLMGCFGPRAEGLEHDGGHATPLDSASIQRYLDFFGTAASCAKGGALFGPP